MMRRVLQTFRQAVEHRAPRVWYGLRYLRRWQREISEALAEITNTTAMSQVSWPSHWPLVSVVITNFNYGQYVEEAIDSVLAQTFQDFEIILIDDGSTDPYTKEVLSALHKPKTRIIFQSNQGVPRTRNNGIKMAQGKYICCLDSDDCLRPTYLEKCIYQLETRNLDVCFSWLETFGASTKIWETGPFLVDVLMRANSVTVSAVFKRTLWEEVGGYKEAMAQGYEDWEFWLTLAEQGAVGYCIPEPLLLHRKHSPSSRSAGMQHRYDEIAAHIKSLHSDLYDKPAYLKKIQKLQKRRFSVANSRCNLSRSSLTT